MLTNLRRSSEVRPLSSGSGQVEKDFNRKRAQSAQYQEVHSMNDPTPTQKPKVTLVGRDGNAFSIIAACRQAARRAGWTPEQVDDLCKEMMSGNYDHVLATALDRFEVE